MTLSGRAKSLTVGFVSTLNAPLAGVAEPPAIAPARPPCEARSVADIEYSASCIQDCDALAVAIASYSEKAQRRIVELEKECEALKEQIALTSRMSVEEMIDEVPRIACI